jgi:hypothetical protein
MVSEDSDINDETLPLARQLFSQQKVMSCSALGGSVIFKPRSPMCFANTKANLTD